MDHTCLEHRYNVNVVYEGWRISYPKIASLKMGPLNTSLTTLLYNDFSSLNWLIQGQMEDVYKRVM